jgi:HEPN domain-containing protein
MLDPLSRTQIEEELSRAKTARADGFEGRARVCARRAAGTAIRAYLNARHAPPPAQSALDLLQLISTQENLPPDIHQVVDHLLIRVNENFQLPETIDLIAEATLLVQFLDKDA